MSHEYIPHIKKLNLQVNARLISSDVRRLQLLNQDDDDSNKQNEIDLNKKNKKDLKRATLESHLLK